MQGQREKWAAVAEKIGLKAGMQVEAPMLGGGPDEQYSGSLYAGTVLAFGKEEALVEK